VVSGERETGGLGDWGTGGLGDWGTGGTEGTVGTSPKPLNP
jgi:hypothetical protein